jgi:hypothetical protein
MTELSSLAMPLEAIEMIVASYMLAMYTHERGICTLCGNRGVVDTRGVRSPAGLEAGRLNYCLCPNGMALRGQGADLPHWLTQQPGGTP